MLLVNIFQSQITKTHDFRQLERGVDYVVDFAESGNFATLTATLGVKQGDKIVLLDQKQNLVMYSAEDLDNYWNDDYLQTILLRRMQEVPE